MWSRPLKPCWKTGLERPTWAALQAPRMSARRWLPSWRPPDWPASAGLFVRLAQARPDDGAYHQGATDQRTQTGVLCKQDGGKEDRIDRFQRDDNAGAAGLKRHQAGYQ